MFYDRFKQLCDDRGVSCNKAALEIGLSNATPTKWRKTGATPNSETLQKIAGYFGVTIQFLLGQETEKTPTLTKKDERDIAKTLEQIMEQLADSDDLMFDGDPMSDEARASMLSAMRVGLEMAKVKNKERFTPNKYKKG